MIDIATTHCLYRILDSKKTSHFQFSAPGLWEIHRNLKQEKNSIIAGPFLEILIASFTMLQKNAFGQKNFEFHARVQKCHFGNFWNFCVVLGSYESPKGLER